MSLFQDIAPSITAYCLTIIFKHMSADLLGNLAFSLFQIKKTCHLLRSPYHILVKLAER